MPPLRNYKSWPTPSTYNENCSVYVFGEEDGSRYKVGIGHDPVKRVSELQADCPCFYWKLPVMP